jgi:hypothetical protein
VTSGSVLTRYAAGTRYGIHLDPDGLRTPPGLHSLAPGEPGYVARYAGPRKLFLRPLLMM